MILKFVLSVCLVAISVVGFGQTEWELAKEKNSIKVFTSKNGTSKFKAIKVEAVLNGTLDKLVKILLDATNNKEWIYNTKESYPLRKISATETISYTETEVPWPASNRDIPINMKLNMDEKNNSLHVTVRGLPKAIPEKKGVVRIPFFDSWWNVKFDGKNKLYITYFLQVDPGGSVPAWITNMFIARGPYETFNSLAGMLAR